MYHGLRQTVREFDQQLDEPLRGDRQAVPVARDHAEAPQQRRIERTDGDGIVPGYDYDTASYNDSLKYAWATVRDNNGNITGALIGFRFPYLVPEVYSKTRSAYYEANDNIPQGKQIGDAIVPADNFDLFIDNGAGTQDRNPNHGDTGHPFFRRWKISVPKGIKGDSLSQLEIIPTKVVPGANIYSDSSCTIVVKQADDATYPIVPLTPIEGITALQIVGSGYTEEDYVYCKIEDTYMLKMRYKLTNYDNKIVGENQSIIIGDYNNIKEVWLTDDGWLCASFTAEDDQIFNDEAIKWIENTEIASDGTIVVTYNTLDEYDENEQDVFVEALTWVNSITLDATNGHLDILYNNDNISGGHYQTDLTWVKQVTLNPAGLLKFIYNNGLGPDELYNDENHIAYEYPIPWITEALLQENGLFKIYFNNDSIKDNFDPANWDDENNAYYTTIAWVNDVQLDPDGTVHFIYNDTTEQVPHEIIPNVKVKYIDDVSINTGMSDDPMYPYEGEGTGNQMVHIVYNTIDSETQEPQQEDIGAPINYILEIIISEYDERYPDTPSNHLLVRYSDPALRELLVETYPDKIWTHKSYKYVSQGEGIIYNDWFDLGFIQGPAGGLHIVGQYNIDVPEADEVDTVNDLFTIVDPDTGLDVILPPEKITHDPDNAGWGYLILNNQTSTKKIWCYDYTKAGDVTGASPTSGTWFALSEFSSIVSDPTSVIILDEANASGSPAHYEFDPGDNGIWLVRTNMVSAY